MNIAVKINQDDRVYIDRLRGLSILRVVLVHLGLSWFFTPYSQFVLVFLPVLFFVSGAVSFPVYLRAQNVMHYGVKRLISVAFPYYLIIGIILIVYFVFYSPGYALVGEPLLRWILISPTSDFMPFPLGQVWFLRVLLVIILLSIPLYSVGRHFPSALLLPVGLSLVLSFTQSYKEIHGLFYVDFFNSYQPLVNAGFFFFGSYYYAFKDTIGTKSLCVLLLVSLLSSMTVFFHAGLDLNMAEHTFSPNLYYIGLSFSAIFAVLLLKPWIQWFLDSVPRFDRLIILYSKHAYGIFIIHSFLIYFSEFVLGWEGVSSKPLQALGKVLLVVFGSLLLSIPVTAITKSCSQWIVNKIYPS